MNSRDIASFDGRITKTNGRIIPAAGRFFESCPNIPHYKVSIPWMFQEQKCTYRSDRLAFQCKADALHREAEVSQESYYENRLYETVVGALLRSYLAKRNPNSAFYYTSRYDDYRSACDYIVSPSGRPEDFVRIDLTVGDSAIRSFEQNHTLPTIQSKIERFSKNSGVSKEFFDAVFPSVPPQPLSLLIIRMSRPILRSFMNDFFETMATEGTKIDILEHFSRWMKRNAFPAKKRVAYILGMEKDGAPGSENGMMELATQVGILFSGIDNVSVEEKK